MNEATEQAQSQADPAAVFACAHSLWKEINKSAREKPRVNLSECYNGLDQFMREVMRAATLFESWCCEHIDFDQTEDVWPYFLEDHFGKTYLLDHGCADLVHFDHEDCLRTAMRLRLPIIPDGKLPVPIDIRAPHLVEGSEFRELRIQTVRNLLTEDAIEPYTFEADPFDENFGEPYFGFYGVDEEGLVEHIADRRTLEEALLLAKNLVAGVTFRNVPKKPPDKNA
jgi:hypothetical protein